MNSSPHSDPCVVSRNTLNPVDVQRTRLDDAVQWSIVVVVILFYCVVACHFQNKNNNSSNHGSNDLRGMDGEGVWCAPQISAFNAAWVMYKIANTKWRRPQSIYLCESDWWDTFAEVTYKVDRISSCSRHLRRRASIDNDDVDEMSIHSRHAKIFGRGAGFQVKRENELWVPTGVLTYF